MHRRVTPPTQVTLPTWGPHLHVNRPLSKKARSTHIAEQLSMPATAWMIWLYAGVRYWPGRGLVYEWPLPYVCLILFYFKQYLVRGAQFSEGGLNEALMKKKKKPSNNWYNKK